RVNKRIDKEPALMVYDSFSGHLKETVKQKFEANYFNLAIIPGNGVTAGGYLCCASISDVCKWVKNARDSISSELILNSFKKITNPIDELEDNNVYELLDEVFVEDKQNTENNMSYDIYYIKSVDGKPKEYVSPEYYVNYLEIFRGQHHAMLKDLIYRANRAVRNNSVYSVTLKPQLAPSKNPHDYLSLARYFWPNPETENGFPYVKKDGFANPEIFLVKDYQYLRTLFHDIQYLGFAYFFTKNETYVEKTLYRLDEWFLNDTTRMNPNINYGSLIKGSRLGRRTGVLDFHPVYRMIQSIYLMRSSRIWNFEIENGATYILQYLGRIDEARIYSKQALINRIETAILPSGQQPYETKRPTSWFYSIFNLNALFLLAERANYFGFDGWRYKSKKGQSIKKAVDYLLHFALNDGHDWPFRNIGEFKYNDFVKILELSYIIYGDKKYLDALILLRPKAKLEQALRNNGATWEDNYLCNWSLMTNSQLWTCLE
ncbi:2888_t:CDS:2, partial [Entrophospora sp. SA101]